MARLGKLGWTAAILGGAAAIGGAVFLMREKRVERPRYRTERADGPIELRAYPQLLVAEVENGGGREAALNRGFRQLAAYIFAKGRPGDKIAMTAPVLSLPSERGWKTRFVMPSVYTVTTLPEPQDGIDLAELPERRVAAICFSGSVDDEVLRAQEDRLSAWLSRSGIVPAGPAEYAFYNSPFTPPALRRNEVLIPIS